jgi:hypothetical protein
MIDRFFIAAAVITAMSEDEQKDDLDETFDFLSDSEGPSTEISSSSSMHGNIIMYDHIASSDNTLSQAQTSFVSLISVWQLIRTAINCYFAGVDLREAPNDSDIFLRTRSHTASTNEIKVSTAPSRPRSDMAVYYDKFNEITSVDGIPRKMKCSITFLLMESPHYHPSCPQQYYDYSSLVKMTNGNGMVKHAHTRKNYPLTEFKLDKGLQKVITVYLRLFKKYYDGLVSILEENRDQLTRKRLPKIVYHRSYSMPVNLIIREVSLANNVMTHFNRSQKKTESKEGHSAQRMKLGFVVSKR